MKSRSHWLPVSEPHHDDWVDGSWTVDCICGVNYDDGEEMVNCDECGVWVHTRCSRYVKSEKSFACDKCKNKSASGGGGIRNESEETEVAEFLIELPTKTLIMDNANPSSISSRMPVRFCAPMEERVHVQGVPGGDPGLFSGLKMSSVFGPQLWKSSGYVPKKFNFRYSEFPYSGDDKVLEKKDEGVNIRNNTGRVDQDDDGAGCLLSLSKENVNNFPAPVVDFVGLKNSAEAGRFHEVQRHKKKMNVKNMESACSENSVKKESRSKQPIVIYSGKRKKEESRMSRVQSTKKRIRSTEQDIDVQRRAARASEAASTFSSDAEQLDFSQGKGSKVVPDRLSDDLGECATNLAANECGSDAIVTDNVTSNEMSKEGIGGEELHVSISGKEEIIGDDIRNRGDTNGDAGSVGYPLHNKESMVGAVKITASDAEESETAQQRNTYEDKSRPIKKLKSEADINGHEPVHVQLDSTKLDNVKYTTQHPQPSPISVEDCKAIETSAVKSEASDLKVHIESPGHTSQSNQERTALEGSSKARKRPFVTKHGSEVAEESQKSNSAVTYTSRASYQCKLVVKSASTSTSVISKSSNKDIIASTAQTPSTTESGQKEVSEKSTDNMNETKTVRADKMFVRTRKLVKDSSRLNSMSNVAQVVKSQSSLDSKRTLSDSQDIKRHSGDSSSSPLIEGASDVQKKATGSAPHVKGEKFYQPGNHSLTSGNVGSTNAPTHPNVPATLSDEELALLLHQELNSSPRVPRVPRMRHAGSLPQIACPTATSLLIKRTSSCGGKDQGMLYKRKSKDLSRDASHGTMEADNEAKKRDKKPSSPDKRKRDTSAYPVSRREVDSGSVKGVYSNKVTNVSNSLSSSSNDANVQSLSTNRPSSRKASVDGKKMAGRSTNRTLPGLVADVTKEGKLTSYEEKCSADYPTSSSRKRRKNDADSLNMETEDNDARAKGARSKGFESRHEELEFPKGKRKARKGRHLALQGRGVVKRRRRADVVSDDESKSYPNSSDEDNMSSSEEEIQGGGDETSSSSDED